MPSKATIVDVALGCAELLTVMVGTWLCYRANRAGDDREFIDRMMSLSLPVSLRALLLALAIGLVYLIAYSVLVPGAAQETTNETTWATFALVVGMAVYVYWRISRAIRCVATDRPLRWRRDGAREAGVPA